MISENENKQSFNTMQVIKRSNLDGIALKLLKNRLRNTVFSYKWYASYMTCSIVREGNSRTD